MATPTAYSYIRFSTKEQKKGDSLRRQREATTGWCARNGVTLDENSTYIDAGVSAFKGKHRENPDVHALAAFLRLVETGRVPQGSFLIVENLDRLTRQKLRAAVRLWMDILDAGVSIVTHSPEKVYRHDSADEVTDMVIAVIELSRGHSESLVKSDRVGSAWRTKKQAAAEGRPQPDRKENRVNGMVLLTHMLPAWLEERGGKIVTIPAAAAAVKRIFQLSAAGYGEMLICRRLAQEGVPAFGRSGRWNKAYVAKILRDERALGVYQPRRRETGKPDGDPIKGYYPPVVSQEEWDACRGAARERCKRPGRVGSHVNVFQGLLKDARTGGTYFSTGRLNGKRTDTHRVLICTEAAEGRAPRVTFPFDTFEATVLSLLREVRPKDILNGDGGPDETEVLAGELARVESSLQALNADMDEHGESPTLMKRVRQKEADQRSLAAALAEARQKALHPLSEAWGECQSLAGAVAGAPDPQDARVRLRSALRRVVESMWLLVVPCPGGRDRLCAVQVWFTGGKRHRDYLIFHRPAKGNRTTRTEGGWRARSLADLVKPGDLDLRDRRDARKLEDLLARLDVVELWGQMVE
jgi:DNA invertase Pin-like site-specific DNA recombinase